jgi:hypothetical protein
MIPSIGCHRHLLREHMLGVISDRHLNHPGLAGFPTFSTLHPFGTWGCTQPPQSPIVPRRPVLYKLRSDGYRSSASLAERHMSIGNSMAAKSRFLAAIEEVRDRGDAAGRLCVACVSTLPVRRAGIVIDVPGVGLEVLSASDPVAERVEWTQITLGEGPAVDAIARGVPQSQPDLAQAQGIWPAFLPEIAEFGIGGVLSVPLQIGAIKVGALDLYCDADAPLGGTAFADAVAISELVTALLLNLDGDGQMPGTLGPWWNQPLSTREVHQATGMVMAQVGANARSAYVCLQAYAFGHQRLLGDVARDVVERRLRFHPDADDSSAPQQPVPKR